MDIFRVQPKVVHGEHALSALKTVPYKKFFVITDPFIVQSGMINDVLGILDKIQGVYKIFTGVQPDPPMEAVLDGVQKLLEFQPEAIIAIGGGSAIDAGKAISFFGQKASGGSRAYFIAIPTTSGTGSEVTSFSVITDREKGIKIPLVDEALLPDMAILDVDLVKSVPPKITADTGMDVLTHAIEAYVSTNANEFTDALAEKAIRLVCMYLITAYKDGNDMKARHKMHVASCLAGMAFDHTNLGLNHGMAHVLGGKFHIPHGRCNAILLPYVMAYNADLKGYNQREYNQAALKYCKIATMKDLPNSPTSRGVRSLIQEIVDLRKALGIPHTLKEAGVAEGDIKAWLEEMAQTALDDGCTSTNPRKPTKEEIVQVFKEAWNGKREF